MWPSETPWDLDKRLKSTIHEANMTLTNGKHWAWFVASLTPHLRMTLSQHKISTQAEALETSMRLHMTPIPDPGLGAHPRATSKLEPRSVEFEARKSVPTRGRLGGRLY